MEQVRRRQRGSAIREFGKGSLTLGLEEGLLVDSPDALHWPTVKSILRPPLAGTFPLNLSGRLFLDFYLLYCRQVRFGQAMTLPRHLGCERPQPFVEILQSLPLPHTAAPRRGERNPPLRPVIRGA